MSVDVNRILFSRFFTTLSNETLNMVKMFAKFVKSVKLLVGFSYGKPEYASWNAFC